MERRDRRGYDRDLARLLLAVFGDGAQRGLGARVYDLERDATRHQAEHDRLAGIERERELLARDFADHPLRDKAVARKVLNHVDEAERAEESRSVFFSRLQGQALILIFSIVQTLILAWVALHVPGVISRPP